MEDVIKRIKKNRAIAFIIVTLTVLSLAVCVYMKQLTKTIDASVVASMRELSRHDMQNIQSELVNSWDTLSSVYTRTQTSQCANIQDVCRRLNLEQISNICGRRDGFVPDDVCDCTHLPDFRDGKSGTKTPQEAAEALDEDCNAAIETGWENSKLHE